MTTTPPLKRPELPAQVEKILTEFLQAAQTSFGKQLQSVVLYGSAAEGQLRQTSDVNLVLVLGAFEQQQADPLREPFRLAHAAIQVRPMFLLADEIAVAASVFAPKFADILRRRVILYGEDPFAVISLSRESEIRQLKQQLLNITLRLRAAYVARSLRNEQLAISIRNALGPLRSYAASLLELEGRPGSPPQQALEQVGAEFAIPEWDRAMQVFAAIREGRLASPGAISEAFFRLLDFSRRLMRRVEAVPAGVSREPL